MRNRKPEQHTPTFLECIGELEKSGHTLRQALLTRNANAIWKTIALQEESLNHLRLCRTMAGAEVDGARPDKQETAGLDPLSREMIKRTRSVLRTNRALARAFLDIIDKTLANIASGDSGGPAVYNRAGKVDPFSTPLLVHQRG
jgi:hypothetical protein